MSRHAAATSRSETPHVVILGAGFGGLEAAKTLRDAPVRVTLVDRNNYHKFQPLLYEVAMAGLEPDDIAHNVRNIFQGEETVHFRLGTATNIDKEAQLVYVKGGEPIPYDYLITATGAVSNDFGIPGVQEHGYPLKNVPDAVNLRNHVLRQFERYDRAPEQATQGKLTFVIVGGGPTGVEMAGALVELFDTLDDDFAAFHPTEEARCILLEMEDDLLPPYEQSLQTYTRKILEERGVEVRTETAVERVEADAVHLNDGSVISSQTLIWAAGVKASPVANMLGVEQARDDRVIVNDDLSVPGYSEVFAVGDMAAIDSSEGYEPQLAQVAIQSGRHAAEQVSRRAKGLETESFSYSNLGQMATIGRNAAVAELPGGVTFKGFFAWLLWVVIHIAKLVGFRNRISAFVDWSYNYFTYNRSARLIVDAVPLSEEIPTEEKDTVQKVEEQMEEVKADVA